MEKPIRIKDIAIKADVSTGTVDRVIHGRGNVSAQKRRKILEVMDDLGYERNIIASALAYNKNFRIAALLPDPNIDSYWKDPNSGIENALKSVQHFGVSSKLYLFDLFDAASFLEKAHQLFEDSPDAILFSPLFLKESKLLLKEAKERGIPNVMINTNIENVDSLCYIGPDSFQSGVLAARLLNFGLSSNSTVIILNLAKGSTNAQHLLQKEKGFRDYFSSLTPNKIEVAKYDFEHFDEEIEMKEFMADLFERHPNLAGIFVTNSRAYRVAAAISSTQAQQIKIVGFDLIQPNLDFLKTNKINFLINQNSVQQGYWGVMSLFNHFILKQEVEKMQYLPLDIVVLENYSYYLQKEKSFQVAL